MLNTVDATLETARCHVGNSPPCQSCKEDLAHLPMSGTVSHEWLPCFVSMKIKGSLIPSHQLTCKAIKRVRIALGGVVEAV